MGTDFNYADNSNNSGHNNPLGARVIQPSAGLMFTCPQIEVNNHPVSPGVMCSQNTGSPSSC